MTMFFTKPLQISLLFLSALGLGMGTIAPLPSNAVSFPSSTPSSGAPPRTSSGAPQRGRCPIAFHEDLDDDGVLEPLTRMTAIVPTNNTINLGSSTLTLMVYMPKNEATSAELAIEEVYEEEVQGVDGQIRIRRKYKEVYTNSTLAIPEDVKNGPRIVTYDLSNLNLKPNTTYQWFLYLNCYDALNALDSVSGVLSCQNNCRVERDVTDPQHLSASELVQQAQDYANQGLWSETVHLTAHLRQFDPTQWTTLLKSQELGCLANVPFAGDQKTEFTVDDDPQCFLDHN